MGEHKAASQLMELAEEAEGRAGERLRHESRGYANADDAARARREDAKADVAARLECLRYEISRVSQSRERKSPDRPARDAEGGERADWDAEEWRWKRDKSGGTISRVSPSYEGKSPDRLARDAGGGEDAAEKWLRDEVSRMSRPRPGTATGR